MFRPQSFHPTIRFLKSTLPVGFRGSLQSLERRRGLFVMPPSSALSDRSQQEACRVPLTAAALTGESQRGAYCIPPPTVTVVHGFPLAQLPPHFSPSRDDPGDILVVACTIAL